MSYRVSLTVLALVVASEAFAFSSAIRTKVLYTGTYGTGDFYVRVEHPIDEPNCTFPNGNRFDIPASHPEIKNWLSVALMAQASGKDVLLRTNGCYEGQPTLDESRATYFLVTE